MVRSLTTSFTVLALTACLLGGCASIAPNRAILRQVERRGLTITDTVSQTITYSVPKVSTDTILTTTTLTTTDTVTVTKDRLTVRYVRVSADTVYLDGECAADTIVREVKVPVPRIVQAPDVWSWQGFVAGLLAATIVVLVGVGVAGRRR